MNDFKIVAKNPTHLVEKIFSAFLVKEHRPRSYYLGNNYTFHEEHNMWTYGCETYFKEAIAHVERLFGCLRNESTILPTDDCHAELDDYPLLNLDKHRTYQMLLGMLQWLVTIDKPELCPLVPVLNRFAS